MRRKTDKINASNHDLKIDQPKTRTYTKRKTKVKKEYSPVKTESYFSEVSEYENSKY